MKLGLENIRKLLTALRNPEQNYLKVQVAGTNGKGSVCAFLDVICVSAGIKTGLYTSPHLVSITERIKIDGHDISEGDFARYASRVRETAEKLLAGGALEYRPTFFEQVTAISLIAFSEAKVELAILETGLGGRLDATTAANAEIAAITRIDYDHQNYLGDTLTGIAAEKAAIIHKGSRVVIGEQLPDAMAVITSVCANLGVSPRLAHEVAAIDGAVLSEPGAVATGFPSGTSSPLSFETHRERYESVRLGLLGRHQIQNAKIAILLAETLQNNFDITPANIVEGLQNARHPGRLEFHCNFLFDGAHNVAGAKALREFLDEFVTRPITLIFGSMNDKDIREIASVLFPKAERLILTQSENSRAFSVDELAKTVPAEFDKDRVIFTSTVEEALTKGKAMVGDDGLILVTGSLYLVGEAKKQLVEGSWQ